MRGGKRHFFAACICSSMLRINVQIFLSFLTTDLTGKANRLLFKFFRVGTPNQRLGRMKSVHGS
jgi:hypothetical protein